MFSSGVRLLILCLLVCCANQVLQSETPKAAESSKLAGYSTASSGRQREREWKFQAEVKAENIRENMRRMSARPHHVGSPYDKDKAEWILAKFKEAGFDAHIETFWVLFPTPKERVVKLLEPTKFRAKLQEPALAVDPTSGQTAEQLPTYNAYSIDGDVTGPLVYVNYGNREDYEQLDRLGISAKGAIVIARYGSGWRGIKPKSRPSTEPSAASFIPTRKMTGTSTATITLKGDGGLARECSAAASWIPIIREIR